MGCAGGGGEADGEAAEDADGEEGEAFGLDGVAAPVDGFGWDGFDSGAGFEHGHDSLIVPAAAADDELFGALGQEVEGLADGAAGEGGEGRRAIIGADRRFDVGLFLVGARGAYGMVLEAFWRGDKEALCQLCDRDVYEGFAAAIDARIAAGETLDSRLIRIEEAKIVAASFDAPVARITVRFTADIASVTRNADGVVVAGSLDDAIESRDVWTFSRDLTSRDPDWLLDETDEG